MAVTQVDYPELAVKAAESVLLELVSILGEYLDHIVLIGGMVPKYLVKSAEEDHVGSTDIEKVEFLLCVDIDGSAIDP